MATKILIIDDDSDTITFLSLILNQAGFQVSSAWNGEEGLRKARQDRPDLIVLDVMMPGMDGYEVTRRLREEGETAPIPIMMYTARSQVEDKVAGYEAGVDFYLVKPIHPIELQANIRSLIKRSETRAVIPKAVHRAYTVGVIGAKGGLGVSTLALNLAIAYQQKQKNAVIAAELQTGQGTWLEELKLNQSGDLDTLLRLGVDQITQQAVEKQLSNTMYGIKLLTASTGFTVAATGGQPEQMKAILEHLTCLGNFIVLDIGTPASPNFQTAVDACHELILVVEPHPVTVRRSRKLIDELHMAGLNSARLITPIVMNRARMDMAMTLTAIEQELGKPVLMGIPPVPEQAFQAAARSVPLLTVLPDGLFTQQMNVLADRMGQRVPR